MIKSYIKKPIEIKAIQYTGDNFSEVKQLCNYCVEVDETPTGGPGPYIIIPTLEGDMIASKDDYIIEGIKGEHYPCKPDIFEASYNDPQKTTTNEISQIKRTIWEQYGISLSTYIDNRFGHYHPFFCDARNIEGKTIYLDNSGEELIENTDELNLLKKAQKLILEKFKPLAIQNCSFN